MFAYRRALAPGGRYLIVGGTMRALLRVLTVGAVDRRTHGSALGLLAVKQGPEQFGQLAQCCVDGSVRIHIDRVFALGARCLRRWRTSVEGRRSARSWC